MPSVTIHDIPAASLEAFEAAAAKQCRPLASYLRDLLLDAQPEPRAPNERRADIEALFREYDEATGGGLRLSLSSKK